MDGEKIMAEKLTVKQELKLEKATEAEATKSRTIQSAIFKPIKPGKPQSTKGNTPDLEALQKIETETLKAPPDKIERIVLKDSRFQLQVVTTKYLVGMVTTILMVVEEMISSKVRMERINLSAEEVTISLRVIEGKTR